MLKRLFGNKAVVTFIAMVVCVAIIAFAYTYRVDREIKAVSVPYAKVKIPARSEITEDMVGTVKVASSMVTETVITDKKQLIGKYVNYNTYIPAGSLFYSPEVVTWDKMPDSAWSKINNDYTIFSFPVTDDTTYGNSIFPGDKIDLYYYAWVNGKLSYEKLIEGIEVLAVKDSSGKHIFKKSDEQRSAAALIFAVPEELHILLRQATMIRNNQLVPVPRGANYNPSTSISNVSLRDYIKSQAREVPQDAE